MEEEQIFQMLRSNNKSEVNQGLQQVYTLFSKGILKTLKRKYGNNINYQSYEDVLQKTMIALWESSNNGKFTLQPGKMEAWLNKVAHNIYSVEQRNRRKKLVLLDGANLDSFIDLVDKVSNTHKRLHFCLGKLKENEKSLFEKIYFQKMKRSDIALSINRDINWINVTHFRCKQKLLNCLSKGSKQ